MREFKLTECPDCTPSQVIRYLEQIRKKYKYVIDESLLSKQELVECNLLFVVSVAKQYMGHGIALEDLIQSGNIGLIEAAETYDATKGFRFISYAVNWIRKEILETISENKTLIKLPKHVQVNLRKLDKVINEYVLLNGEFPSEFYLNEITQVPIKYIHLYLFDKSIISTDTYIVSETTNSVQSFYDVYCDESFNSTWVDIENNKQMINRLLTILTDKERQIITDIYLKEHSINQVAEDCKLTHERIRQICVKSLDKMYKYYKKINL